MRILAFALLALFFSGCASLGGQIPKPSVSKFSKELEKYPSAKKGQVRYALSLAPLKDEQNYFLLIKFTKELVLDCNHYFLGGAKLERHILKGWGYEYYELKAGGELLAGTKMACPNQKPKKKFINYALDELKLAYNSKLALVFYLPDSVFLRYEIFKKVQDGLAP